MVVVGVLEKERGSVAQKAPYLVFQLPIRILPLTTYLPSHLGHDFDSKYQRRWAISPWISGSYQGLQRLETCSLEVQKDNQHGKTPNIDVEIQVGFSVTRS